MLFDCLNDGDKAEGVVHVRESDVCVREGLEGCADGESFVGEERTAERVVVFSEVLRLCAWPLLFC